ncbi:non-functional NADPH-dependent codeinone reductase 2-like [Macadamia integrifolia]|uniref:non-functional NADPH-dependent codeinone reductase 2-like n=1 Tax=Macadamia integrifolia TaxID=60698 RepID=UPI001C4E9A7B|nr:non-functional NADPH-dependent codeinone reductase 2-like [Macadamia integrifolia]
MVTIPEVSMGSTGLVVPSLGMGMAVYPLTSSETMKSAILHAIQLGYRHFDTAAIYRSQHPLGEAIKEAQRLGFIKSRDELFITSKLWCSEAHHGCVLPALKKTLQILQLEYLDLYLIHCPAILKLEGYELPMGFKSIWESMEKSQKLGLTRFIGVSNFCYRKLEELLVDVKIPPAINQVEMNPVWQQKKLREFCKEKGIHITAYSPLGAKGTLWGTNRAMECEVLKQIAEAKRKTVAQVCLRWVYEQGMSIIVKSLNKERLKENLEIFDWMLSQEELQKIDGISQQKRSSGLEEFISEENPYKSLDELCDGETS